MWLLHGCQRFSHVKYNFHFLKESSRLHETSHTTEENSKARSEALQYLCGGILHGGKGFVVLPGKIGSESWQAWRDRSATNLHLGTGELAPTVAIYVNLNLGAD